MLRRPHRFTTLRSAAAAAVLTSSLAACSSGADPRDLSATSTPFTASSQVTTAAPNPDANTSPSPGAVVSGDRGFNLVVPPGWNLTKNAKAVAYLSSATSAHDVAPTIVVTRSTVSPAPALDDTRRLAMLHAKQDGQSVGTAPERTVGAERAVAFTGTSSEHNVTLQRTYVMVAHAKSLYLITLTGAKVDAAKDDAVLTSVLSSWTWTKAGAPGSTASGTTPAAVPTTTAQSPSPSSSGASSSDASASGSASAGSPSKSAAASSKPSQASATASSTTSR